MNTIPILFTFDTSLELPACVCMSSLLMNAGPDTFYDIFVLHSDRYDFSGSKLNRLPEYYPNCKITFRKVSNEFIGAYEVRGITETCYYRLLAPELITEYDKIIYSDVDVIFRDDLTRYYNLDLGDNYFAAVDNCSRLRPGVQKYVTEALHYDWHEGYYYSGNLVINLSKLMKDGKTSEFRELSKNNYLQQDMDIMNIACHGHFLRLSPAFCMTNFLYSLIVRRRSGMEEEFAPAELDYALSKGIVHYNGAKPWNTWCHHFDIWWEYFRKSPFYSDEFYLDFYHSKDDELDKLSLWKRVKILYRFFSVGRKK